MAKKVPRSYPFASDKDGDYTMHKGGAAGKVHKVMHEFKGRTLKSGSGATVTKRGQAVARAMSEAGLSKKKGKGR